MGKGSDFFSREGMTGSRIGAAVFPFAVFFGAVCTGLFFFLVRVLSWLSVKVSSLPPAAFPVTTPAVPAAAAV